MKNKLPDLNNHLFAQLERLGNESLKGEKLQDEINRAKAISTVADKVIQNASLVLEAHKTQLEYAKSAEDLPPMLGHQK